MEKQPITNRRKILVPEAYRRTIEQCSDLSPYHDGILFYNYQQSPVGFASKILRKLGISKSGPRELVLLSKWEERDRDAVAGAVLDWGIRAEELNRLLAWAPRLRWLHAMSSGVDHLPLREIFAKSIALTSCKGLRNQAVSEYAMGLIYLAAKRFLDHHRSGNRNVVRSKTVAGSVLVVLGTGSIGRSLATLAQKNGMHPLGVNRSGNHVEGFDRIYPVDRLEDAVAQADFLVLCLPLTQRTHHLMNARTLSAIKPGAFLVNVGREGLVESAALDPLVRSGRIAGAALDIDPPGKTHPYLKNPGILITNHSAFSTDRDEGEMLERLVDNLLRFFQKKELKGEITPEKEY
jgi:phosphoglycerate dehydrogenase-like enzyme